MDVQICAASYEDLPEVARIHVAAWKQAYVGQVPQTSLDRIEVADRLRRWQEQFADRIISGVLLARVNGSAAGFVCFGGGRDQDRKAWGEIYAIYVTEDHWDDGIGYQLHKQACGELRHRGYKHAFLWVLNTNSRAIRAYERWGGSVERDRTKEDEIGGQTVQEVSVSFAL